MESIVGVMEANAFAGFMLGWLVLLIGGTMRMIVGGFRDKTSAVPVLGNLEEMKPGDKGFLQQVIGGWAIKMGLLLIVVCGLIYFL